MTTTKELLINVAHELERERDAAFNLWTWLPSCKEAEKYHGDYATEYTPSVADIIIEASMFIGHKLNPTDEEKERAGNWYKCPCGEEHEPGDKVP